MGDDAQNARKAAIEMERCRRVVPADGRFGFIYFIENYCVWREDRIEEQLALGLTQHYFKPKLFDMQKELLWAWHGHWDGKIWRPQHVLGEKSRGVGITWTALSYLLWGFLFDQGFSGLLGSRIETDVDDNRTEGCLFGKLGFMYSQLPEWMKPHHDMRKVRAYRTFFNPGNPQFNNLGVGNFLGGECGNAQFGTSRRYKRVFADEFAKWEYQEQSWASVQPTGEAVLLLSTPQGRGNAFARLRFHPHPEQIGVKIMSFPWWNRPGMNVGKHYDAEQGKWRSPWYDQQFAELAALSGPAFARQELDMSYDLSVQGRVYYSFQRNLHCKDGIGYTSLLPLGLGADHGRNCEFIIFFQWTNQGDCYVIDEIVTVDKHTEQNAELVVEKLETWRDEDGQPAKLERAYGDPSGSAERPEAARTIHQIYRAAGIDIRPNRMRDIQAGANIVNGMFTRRQLWINPATCPNLVQSLENHCYQTDIGTGFAKERLVDNWAKHGADALRYPLVNIFKPLRKQPGRVVDVWGWRKDATT